jgi:rhodanese-related sulfurtransferase
VNVFKIFKSLFTPVSRLTPAECADRVRAGEALIIDVREPAEWNQGVAQKANLLSLSDLTTTRSQWRRFLAENNGKELLFYCASGGRSGMAARILGKEGFRTANTGGLSDWAASGWPIVKPIKLGR